MGCGSARSGGRGKGYEEETHRGGSCIMHAAGLGNVYSPLHATATCIYIRVRKLVATVVVLVVSSLSDAVG